MCLFATKHWKQKKGFCPQKVERCTNFTTWEKVCGNNLKFKRKKNRLKGWWNAGTQVWETKHSERGLKAGVYYTFLSIPRLCSQILHERDLFAWYLGKPTFSPQPTKFFDSTKRKKNCQRMSLLLIFHSQHCLFLIWRTCKIKTRTHKHWQTHPPTQHCLHFACWPAGVQERGQVYLSSNSSMVSAGKP
jgi:hypothetical protein